MDEFIVFWVYAERVLAVLEVSEYVLINSAVSAVGAEEVGHFCWVKGW